jgi:hypothetical protein
MFQPIKRTLIVVVITGVIGYFYYIVQYSISLDTIILLNVFAQTLPTSIAEVVICWVILGITFESFIQPDGRRVRGRRITSIIIGAIVATILFGVYHFAHSPPFNQPNMVLFLIYSGILSSIDIL